MTPPTGRPKSKNPKSYEAKARIDEKMNSDLERYCKKNNKTKTEVIREGIRKVIYKK